MAARRVRRAVPARQRGQAPLPDEALARGARPVRQVHEPANAARRAPLRLGRRRGPPERRRRLRARHARRPRLPARPAQRDADERLRDGQEARRFGESRGQRPRGLRGGARGRVDRPGEPRDEAALGGARQRRQEPAARQHVAPLGRVLRPRPRARPQEDGRQPRDQAQRPHGLRGRSRPRERRESPRGAPQGQGQGQVHLGRHGVGSPVDDRRNRALRRQQGLGRLRGAGRLRLGRPFGAHQGGRLRVFTAQRETHEPPGPPAQGHAPARPPHQAARVPRHPRRARALRRLRGHAHLRHGAAPRLRHAARRARARGRGPRDAPRGARGHHSHHARGLRDGRLDALRASQRGGPPDRHVQAPRLGPARRVLFAPPEARRRVVRRRVHSRPRHRDRPDDPAGDRQAQGLGRAPNRRVHHSGLVGRLSDAPRGAPGRRGLRGAGRRPPRPRRRPFAGSGRCGRPLVRLPRRPDGKGHCRLRGLSARARALGQVRVGGGGRDPVWEEGEEAQGAAVAHPEARENGHAVDVDSRRRQRRARRRDPRADFVGRRSVGRDGDAAHDAQRVLRARARAHGVGRDDVVLPRPRPGHDAPHHAAERHRRALGRLFYLPSHRGRGGQDGRAGATEARTDDARREDRPPRGLEGPVHHRDHGPLGPRHLRRLRALAEKRLRRPTDHRHHQGARAVARVHGGGPHRSDQARRRHSDDGRHVRRDQSRDRARLVPPRRREALRRDGARAPRRVVRRDELHVPRVDFQRRLEDFSPAHRRHDGLHLGRRLENPRRVRRADVPRPRRVQRLRRLRLRHLHVPALPHARHRGVHQDRAARRHGRRRLLP
mmetsp:Transcript_25173/g.77591  ORF Transcript_25173/g.77591 Transcript_25173/m.77591 type:complete len:833 (-) Transcript_25173:541-3039(-)